MRKTVVITGGNSGIGLAMPTRRHRLSGLPRSATTGWMRSSITQADQARGRKPYRVLPAYGQSKLGNLMFSNTLAHKLPAGITSQAMHPGGVASPIYRELPRWQYALMRPFLIGPARRVKLQGY